MMKETYATIPDRVITATSLTIDEENIMLAGSWG
jgi:hypothetical protein